MGNGPSLNVTPLEKLSTDYVWGVNRCSLLFDRIQWRPQFYVAVDTRVVPDNAAEIMRFVQESPGTSFYFPVYFRLYRSLESAPNIYWFRQREIDHAYPAGYFSTDVPSYVRKVSTVTISALQLAVHLGFDPIYLVGCDTSYQVPGSAIYEDGSRKFIIGSADDDPNHFSPAYFGEGKKYHQPYPERMVQGYSQVKQVSDGLGISVLNATVGGSLEVFPRVDFESLF